MAIRYFCLALLIDTKRERKVTPVALKMAQHQISKLHHLAPEGHLNWTPRETLINSPPQARGMHA
jgi:hypothetical protein